MPMVRVSNGGTNPAPVCVLSSFNSGGYYLQVDFMDGTNNSSHTIWYMETQSASFENDYIKITSSGYSWTVLFKKAAVGYKCEGRGAVANNTPPTSFTQNQTVTYGLNQGFIISW